MKTKILVLILLSCISQNLFSQKKLPVIRATSPIVDIREDNKLYKKAWNIVPQEKLDVYTTSGKKVTFYTDIDSITFKVEPQKNYDFIILLNGKDSARTQIKYQPSKLDVLKRSGKYNYSDNSYTPKFTYQSSENIELQKIRKELKLDSIAGKGNELSQIFNLMHWLHNLIRHDGNSSNPASQNAVDLIKVCKAKNRGVNCRMLAITLNECYLAMGIQSRAVTCMVKDKNDNDSHVINMVFSKDLNKWIWMDPTFNAYVMDDKGNLLGVEEVRKKLIKNEPLVLNADANWNRELMQTKEGYLYNYMAKNLYRLQTPLMSEYDAETLKKGKEIIYVDLLTSDEFEQAQQKKEILYKDINAKLVFYKLSNPDLFWEKP
ncbi:transglutaminase-like domain-containing protein [Chryseobacterium sp. RLHN22]|uniref:transglutaminase-like domain-containing protein n=1 Tax=Chryseobacterium sp. RLHN22 TaxID=3437885 RepID=UPI003D9BEB11